MLGLCIVRLAEMHILCWKDVFPPQNEGFWRIFPATGYADGTPKRHIHGPNRVDWYTICVDWSAWCDRADCIIFLFKAQCWILTRNCGFGCLGRASLKVTSFHSFWTRLPIRCSTTPIFSWWRVEILGLLKFHVYLLPLNSYSTAKTWMEFRHSRWKWRFWGILNPKRSLVRSKPLKGFSWDDGSTPSSEPSYVKFGRVVWSGLLDWWPHFRFQLLPSAMMDNKNAYNLRLMHACKTNNMYWPLTLLQV